MFVYVGFLTATMQEMEYLDKNIFQKVKSFFTSDDDLKRWGQTENWQKSDQRRATAVCEQSEAVDEWAACQGMSWYLRFEFAVHSYSLFTSIFAVHCYSWLTTVQVIYM